MTSDEARAIDRVEAFRRRPPRLTGDVVTLAHGAGGKAAAALVETVFRARFGTAGTPAGDAAVLTVPGGRLAFSTDAHVVAPRRFPGGSLGTLAVHGTVNDLAVAGARPAWLSAAFVIEEGFALDELAALADDMAAAAAEAGVALVTGDTKVVERGAADGVYVTTAGIGVIPDGRHLGPDLVRPGDRVLISGTIGEHGLAVLLARGDLAIEADIASDTAPVSGLVEALLAAAPGTSWMRDPTRGGLATTADELAADSGLGVVLDEAALPVPAVVAGACDLLGIDPLYVANEGKVVAVVPADQAGDALATLRAHPLGAAATDIGEIVADPAGIVVARTALGGTRIVDRLVGDPLPRIC